MKQLLLIFCAVVAVVVIALLAYGAGNIAGRERVDGKVLQQLQKPWVAHAVYKHAVAEATAHRKTTRTDVPVLTFIDSCVREAGNPSYLVNDEWGNTLVTVMDRAKSDDVGSKEGK